MEILQKWAISSIFLGFSNVFCIGNQTNLLELSLLFDYSLLLAHLIEEYECNSLCRFTHGSPELFRSVFMT